MWALMRVVRAGCFPGGRAWLFFLLLAICLSATSSRAVVSTTVYDNTSNPFVITLAGEVGDTVTLAGAERFITRLSIGVFAQNNQPGNDIFDLTLWTASGPGGSIGSLIWDGGPVNRSLAGPLELISFDVPN